MIGPRQTRCPICSHAKTKEGRSANPKKFHHGHLKKSTSSPIKFLAMNKSQHFFRLLAGAAFLSMGVTVACASPSSPVAIGVAVANGSFQVNHTRVAGNATLFDGSTIETADSASQIRLDGGAQVRLAAGSRAQVFQNKLILESGFSQMEAGPGYEVEARTLHIAAVSPATVSRIRMSADGKVEAVAAMEGTLKVRNSMGLLVANVPSGASVDF